MPGWELIAKGRVQGVGFRWFVLDCAKKFGIKGYVRNLANGTVQVVAVGESAKFGLFVDEIKQGNRHTQIEQLLINELTHFTEYEEFFIA